MIGSKSYFRAPSLTSRAPIAPSLFFLPNGIVVQGKGVRWLGGGACSFFSRGRDVIHYYCPLLNEGGRHRRNGSELKRNKKKGTFVSFETAIIEYCVCPVVPVPRQHTTQDTSRHHHDSFVTHQSASVPV